jgi:hypothetical protein
MEMTVLVICGLVEHFDRVKGNVGDDRRFGYLGAAGHLVQLQCRTMLGAVVPGQLGDIDRDQFFALQGTHDDLLALLIVCDQWCHQVTEYRLQQKPDDQHPGRQ